jgi:transcriptional regulator with XRE-family HTH domain
MRGGELIREARRRASLTQQEVADRLGTTQSVVTRWETGARSPSFETVVRAIRACGLELAVTIGPPDIDHELFIRENLRLSPAERLDRLTEQQEGLRQLVYSAQKQKRKGGQEAVS